MGHARRADKKDPLRAVAVSQSSGLCMATKGSWGDAHARRCRRPMDDVFLDETGTMLVLCYDCRVRSLGLTAAEKGKRVKAQKESQQSLLTPEEMKVKND